MKGVLRDRFLICFFKSLVPKSRSIDQIQVDKHFKGVLPKQFWRLHEWANSLLNLLAKHGCANLQVCENFYRQSDRILCASAEAEC